MNSKIVLYGAFVALLLGSSVVVVCWRRNSSTAPGAAQVQAQAESALILPTTNFDDSGAARVIRRVHPYPPELLPEHLRAFSNAYVYYEYEPGKPLPWRVRELYASWTGVFDEAAVRYYLSFMNAPYLPAVSNALQVGFSKGFRAPTNLLEFLECMKWCARVANPKMMQTTDPIFTNVLFPAWIKYANPYNDPDYYSNTTR